MIAGRRGHVDGPARPELAMAAAVSGVVRRVEELGDLAQAHIQHLSEAAGEDGEGAPQREAGGRWGDPRGRRARWPEGAACGSRRGPWSWPSEGWRF